MLFSFPFAHAMAQGGGYWNRNTHLVPWRFPLVNPELVERLDLTGDGKPDVIRGLLLPDSLPFMWIDQDGSMTWDCLEGNTVNGLLLVDRNRDGYFDGPRDLIIKWGDRNNSGTPDVMMVVQNGGERMHHYFDWGADYMIVIDNEDQGILNHVDWNLALLQCWEHEGRANFFPDYHGNVKFLKMHGSSYRLNDMRFSWENPFIFYCEDGDSFTEWTIRLVDEPYFRPSEGHDPRFDDQPEQIDTKFSGKIRDVRMSWDMDNDNGPGNEFDYDMSIKLRGPGFDYSDQVHPFEVLTCKNIDLFPDTFWLDNRWGHLSELIYPGRDVAWDMIWNEGVWTECHFVFDEDDDCHRWERVELYDPLDIFISGTEQGGLDHNRQADATGDRGNWDMDFSGGGNLYVGGFDGKIHLHGAEWGAWRIDQTAFYYQGFGGNYGRWARDRQQRHAESFAVIRYSDTNDSGFFDLIEYDLDGDGVFEDIISLTELGIDDTNPVIITSEMDYQDFNNLFIEVAESSFSRGMEAVETAERLGLDTHWYNFYKKPESLFQKYQYGYWLAFYIYGDLRQMAVFKGDEALETLIKRVYYSNNWGLLNQ